MGGSSRIRYNPPWLPRPQISSPLFRRLLQLQLCPRSNRLVRTLAFELGEVDFDPQTRSIRQSNPAILLCRVGAFGHLAEQVVILALTFVNHEIPAHRHGGHRRHVGYRPTALMRRPFYPTRL